MRVLILLIAFILPLSAMAAEPVIVINPDGSFSVNDDVPVAKEKPVKAKPAPVQKPPAVKSAPKPKAPVAEAPPPADSVFEPLEPPSAIAEPERPKDVQPVEKPPVKKTPAKKPQVKKAAAKPSPEPAPMAAPPAVVEAPVMMGPVTPDEARRIAIRTGPAASRVDVYPADFNGLKVFQVVFKTDNGEEYILVDRQTGEIVREKPKSGKKKK